MSSLVSIVSGRTHGYGRVKEGLDLVEAHHKLDIVHQNRVSFHIAEGLVVRNQVSVVEYPLREVTTQADVSFMPGILKLYDMIDTYNDHQDAGGIFPFLNQWI